MIITKIKEKLRIDRKMSLIGIATLALLATNITGAACLPASFGSQGCSDDPPGAGDYHWVSSTASVYTCVPVDNEHCCRCEKWSETYQWNFFPYWTFTKQRADLYNWQERHCVENVCLNNSLPGDGL